MTRSIFTGSKSSLRIPLLGEAFFTSAIKPGNPVRRLEALRAAMKSLLGGAFSRAFFSIPRGFLSFNWKSKFKGIRGRTSKYITKKQITKGLRNREREPVRLPCPCSIQFLPKCYEECYPHSVTETQKGPHNAMVDQLVVFSWFLYPG